MTSTNQSTAFALPIELWRNIFHYAVHIPGALDVGLNDPSQERNELSFRKGWPTIEKLLIQAPLSMSTRRSIVLVSPLWKDIAMEFVHEIVDIRSPAAAHRFLQILQRDDDKERRFQRGWWIKRIDISFFDSTSDTSSYLQQIFQRCHNLQIVKFKSSAFSFLLPTICAHCPHLLAFMPLYLNPQSQAWNTIDLLRGVRVKVLDIILASIAEEDIFPAVIDPSGTPFENVSSLTLRLNYFTAKALHWHLPSLSHLRIIATSINNFDFIGSFIACHASTLTSFNAHIQLIHDIPNLSRNLNLCQRLLDLSIDDVVLGQLDPDFTLPLTERLYVWVRSPKDTPNLAPIMIKLIESSVFPTLRLFQADGLDAENLESLQPLPMVCQRRNISLKIKPAGKVHTLDG